LPKCCAEHQKPDAFQRFCPTFQKLFLKRDLFDSFNGWRYLLAGGTRQRHFAGTNSKPHKPPENAATPTTMAPALFAGDRVRALLGIL
jgi:hypothetical protein